MLFLSAALLLARTVTSFQPCPIFGPGFPAPKNLSASSILKPAFANFTSLIDSIISSSKSKYGPFDSNTTTFSLEFFSTSSDVSLYEYHHIAPGLGYSGTGVRTVDSNSIYRVGSATKLLAVYSFLIAAGDAIFHDPVTKWVPELKAAASSSSGQKDPVNHVVWGNNYYRSVGSVEDEITQVKPTLYWTAAGFPLLKNASIPTCGIDPLCDRKEFFQNFLQRPPIYLPGTTPVYSNVAYQILIYALESITGQKFSVIFEKNLVQALNLTRTALSLPKNDTLTKNGIIPVSVVESSWAFDAGDEDPAGSAYSTPRELSSIGRSILLGAPFEIATFTDPNTGQIVDLYTKSGNIGAYASLSILSPDYGVGFSVMAAGAHNFETVLVVSQLLVDQFVPATISAARNEANASYTGVYTSSDPALNSSLTLTTRSSQLGLSVSEWISNGTDMLAWSAEMIFQDSGSPAEVTLYPTNLKTVLSDGSYEMAFRAVFEDPTAINPGGLFTNTCLSWAFTEEVVYGRLSLDEFVFTVGTDGIAHAVVPSALRAMLKKP
ncbi:hypothetical protein H2200_008289 [Cladophialophora chaetospira]|uniref:Beta-lactamase-related domain-containing protein n=1 Tax=Cladophialophora chaetospira TaxID=386627 RepID=A0AA38X5N8_9EURO|nr:hypothetical protein H2200_008289 [Cladophialophora chaetospira]